MKRKYFFEVSYRKCDAYKPFQLTFNGANYLLGIDRS